MNENLRIDGKQVVIFCDFDGTITERDMIILLMEHFGGEGWQDIAREIVERKLSIRDGVGQMFHTIPSRKKESMIETALRGGQIREGFGDFVQFCRETGIELLITSGGVDFFLEPMLEPYGLEGRIYCNKAEFDEAFIRIEWPHPCDASCELDCGMCKVTIARRYPENQYYRIVIGDSLTDFAASQVVDYVIARSHLLRECEKKGIAHSFFDSFHDVTNAIKKLA